MHRAGKPEANIGLALNPAKFPVHTARDARPARSITSRNGSQIAGVTFWPDCGTSMENGGRMKLSNISARSDRANTGLLICFSHLRWSFVYQRPQHLMSRAVRDQNVVFFEEPLFEGSRPPHLKLHEDPSGVTVAEPIFPLGFELSITNALRVLLDDMIERLGTAPNVLWYYTPMALEFSRHIRSTTCVYDNMDELSAFRGASPKLLELEQELFDRADTVFTGGHSLFKAKRHRHDNIHAFPSSVDIAHFSKARSLIADPADQIALPHPRLGFFGVIDERMDLALVAEIARRRPDWQLVMIGPVTKIDPDTLPRHPNIAWLGMKSYAELPSYLSGWDIGIMPFARNESTKYISPTKTPEFLSAGIPVICTSIADVIDPYGSLGLAEIADDADGFIAASERLLMTPKGNWLGKVDSYLAGISWDRTWSAMEALIRKLGVIQETPRRAARNDTLHV